MLEEFCRQAFYSACYDIVHEERLVYLRGYPHSVDEKKREFRDFFCFSSHFSPWYTPSKNKVLYRKCLSWMHENAERLCGAYIRNVYGGDLPGAMRLAGNFDVLFNDFKSDFSNRRALLMKKTDAQLAKKRGELAKKGGGPQSHGGVANLLKVLTKTMNAQGSSVYTIAKVQYAVCMQAGIYIPDEFLTDVLVAEVMIEEGNNGQADI